MKSQKKLYELKDKPVKSLLRIRKFLEWLSIAFLLLCAKSIIMGSALLVALMVLYGFLSLRIYQMVGGFVSGGRVIRGRQGFWRHCLQILVIVVLIAAAIGFVVFRMGDFVN